MSAVLTRLLPASIRYDFQAFMMRYGVVILLGLIIFARGALHMVFAPFHWAGVITGR